MRLVLFGSVWVMLATNVAHGQGMPRYDVDQWCNQVAASGGSYSYVIKAECVAQEQSSYDAVKPNWMSLPGRTRAWCDEVAHSGGAGSYVILGGCIQQEISASQRSTGTSFHY
jgi:hypothetical protein